MKRPALIFLALLLSGSAVAQADPMLYFIGKWKFNVWFAGSKSSKADLKAIWLLEKKDGQDFEATGKVLMDGKGETTKEMMGYDKVKGLYSRTIVSSDGLFFFTSSGWKGDSLTWEGRMAPLSDQYVEMKEEIVRISDNEFHATFYKKTNGEWVLTSKEVLKRTKA
jgi:hypothetical protein